MRLPWWPIRVKAEIESEGVRVVGDEGGGQLPVGTLVPWWRVIGQPHRCLPVDVSGQLLKHRGGLIEFDFGSAFAFRRKPLARQMNHARDQWMADPSNGFEIVLATDKEYVVVRDHLIFGLYLGVCLMIPAVLMMFNQYDRADGTVLTHDLRRVYLILNVLAGTLCVGGLFLVIGTIRSGLRARRSWWITSINQDTITIKKSGETRTASWNDFGPIRGEGNLAYLVYKGDDRSARVYWARNLGVSFALQSRLAPEPKLITPMFVMTGLIAIAAGPACAWIYRWLDVEFIEGGAFLLSSLCILLWGMLILHHARARRGRLRTHETE